MRSRNSHDLAWLLDAQIDPAAVQAVVEGAILADYDADRYRTERNSERRVDQLQLVTGGAVPGDEAQRALARGGIIAEAQNFSRDLVNEPPNFLTPTVLAERAKDMAAQYGLDCQVLGAEEIRGLKMGAFWSVAQGSDEPPKLIVLRYTPADAPDSP